MSCRQTMNFKSVEIRGGGRLRYGKKPFVDLRHVTTLIWLLLPIISKVNLAILGNLDVGIHGEGGEYGLFLQAALTGRSRNRLDFERGESVTTLDDN